MKIRFVLGVMVVLLAVSVPAARSQTLYTVHGGTPVTSTVTELKGPPSLPLGFPGGPVVSTFPTTVPFACPTAGVIPPPPVGVLGDVAYDPVGDIVWVTDGFTITSYSPAGVPLKSFAAPFVMGPLTGLGFFGAAGVLLMTDGPTIMIAIPPAGACPFLFPGVPGPSPSPGPLTDIEWDPVSGTMFGCDELGFVTNIAPAGGVGPFGVFPVAGLCAPGLGPKLQGLAVDTTAVGVPVLYVTDGFAINRVSPPGVAAVGTFYTPAPCFPVLAAAPVNGLAFSLHAITFSLPCHTAGGMLPMISSTGASTTPGAMVLTIAGAPPFGMVNLRMSLGVAPVPFKGCSLIDAVPINSLLLPVGAAGVIVLPAVLPPGLPPGLSLYFQAVCLGAPGVGITPGLGLTFGVP